MVESGKPDVRAVLAHYGFEVPHSPSEFGWSKMRCINPNHDDRHPSATINVTENRWACFACGINQDSYEVIMEQENVTFADARRIAKDRAWGSGNPVRPVPRNGRGVSPRTLWD